MTIFEGYIKFKDKKVAQRQHILLKVLNAITGSFVIPFTTYVIIILKRKKSCKSHNSWRISSPPKLKDYSQLWNSDKKYVEFFRLVDNHSFILGVIRSMTINEFSSPTNYMLPSYITLICYQVNNYTIFIKGKTIMHVHWNKFIELMTIFYVFSCFLREKIQFKITWTR